MEHGPESRVSAMKIGEVASASGGDRDADPPQPPPARSAFEKCPDDALPLQRDAVGKSVRATLADARDWVRADAGLEVAGAARGVLRDPAPGCTEAFGERAVL